MAKTRHNFINKWIKTMLNCTVWHCAVLCCLLSTWSSSLLCSALGWCIWLSTNLDKEFSHFRLKQSLHWTDWGSKWKISHNQLLHGLGYRSTVSLIYKVMLAAAIPVDSFINKPKQTHRAETNQAAVAYNSLRC